MFKKDNVRYQHIIITHFNIRWKTVSKKGRFELFKNPLSQEWMDHRFDLFDKYCYPSITNQTNQDFDWFVFFDPAITDKERLKQYDRITPIFIPSGIFFNPSHVCKHINPLILDFLITTNLDNDDSLNINYVETLHNSLTGKYNVEVVEFPHGYLFDHSTRETRSYHEEHGAFMSLIEKPNSTRLRGSSRRIPFKTIRFADHRHIVKKIRSNYTRIETDEPMWLQVVHDKNAKNLMDRGDIIPNSTSEFSSLFNVQVEQDKM